MATLLPIIEDIGFSGVYDRGVPNQERVVYRIVHQANLGEYMLSLAATDPSGNVVPLPNNLLWLGEELVSEIESWFQRGIRCSGRRRRLFRCCTVCVSRRVGRRSLRV